MQAETFYKNDAQKSPDASMAALDPKVWRVAGVVFLGPLMSQMDATVVNVSLARIGDQLSATIYQAHWIVSAYLLTLALVLPLTAYLVARWGAKRIYLASFSLFTLSSVFCGTATTLSELITARIFQGMAGGLLAPLTSLMIARVAGRHMPLVMGYTQIPVLLAPLLGPVLAGLILQKASWPWLFFINLPLGLLAVCLAYWLLPADPVQGERRRFDLLGFLLVSPGLACFLVGLERVNTTHEFSWLIVGLILCGSFIRHIFHQSDALIDPKLFSAPLFRTVCTLQFFSNAGIFASQFILPLYLMQICGFSASQAGLLLAPVGLGMLCTFPFLGRLTDKFGCRALATSGAALVVLSCTLLTGMSHLTFDARLFAFGLFLRGLGQGAVGVPATSAAYADLTGSLLAQATSTLSIIQRLGGPIATTCIALLMNYVTVTTTITISGIQWALSFLLGLQVIVLLLSCKLPIWVYPPETTQSHSP